MKVSFLNLDREGEALIELGLMTDIEKVIRSGCFLFGPKSIELEEKLSEFFGKPTVLVKNGTDALILSLKALGIKYGDLVAIPALSAIPTAVAVHAVGAIPIYIDIDSYFTMDVTELQKAINNYPIKAVIPVHLYGNSSDIGAIRCICQKESIILIEDCAQSFGSKSKSGNILGTLGMAGAFSFYPTKNLGACGDAACIVACDDNLAKTIKEIRFYGQVSKYKMGKMIGLNSRVDEIQSVILLNKLKIFPKLMQKRLEMKALYDGEFGKTQIWGPAWREGAVPHLYPIVVLNREEKIKALAERGIETAIHYPFHLKEEVENLPGVGEYSMAKAYSKGLLSIPFHPWMTDDEIEYTIKNVQEVCK